MSNAPLPGVSLEQLVSELQLAEQFSGGDTEAAQMIAVALEDHALFFPGKPVEPAQVAQFRAKIAVFLLPQYVNGGDAATIDHLLNEWGSIAHVRGTDLDAEADGVVRRSLRDSTEAYGTPSATLTQAETRVVRRLLVTLLTGLRLPDFRPS